MTQWLRLLLVVSVFPLFANSLDEGIKYFEAGEFNKAQTVFEMLIDDNDENASAHYWLGRTFYQLSNFEEASEYLEEAIDLDQNNADYHFWYGNALGQEIQTANILRQAMMAGDILDAYESAIKINPKHIGAHIGAAQFYLRAPSIAGGDIEKAKEEVKILKELGSKDGDLLHVGILVQQEKFEQAENANDSFHTHFADSTDNPQFYNGYGYFLLVVSKVL